MWTCEVCGYVEFVDVCPGGIGCLEGPEPLGSPVALTAHPPRGIRNLLGLDQPHLHRGKTPNLCTHASAGQHWKRAKSPPLLCRSSGLRKTNQKTRSGTGLVAHVRHAPSAPLGCPGSARCAGQMLRRTSGAFLLPPFIPSPAERKPAAERGHRAAPAYLSPGRSVIFVNAY